MNLHGDLMIEILSHLPVKSLVRFQSVCRRWNSIINNQQFITKHCKNQISRNMVNSLLLLTYHYNLGTNNALSISTLGYDCNNNAERSSYRQKFNRPHFHHRANQTIRPRSSLPWFYNVSAILIGQCNGLVCMLVDMKLILWNPSTRKFKNLMNYSVVRPPWKLDGVGFGFDPMSKDFKVISFWRGGLDNKKIHVEICYLSKKYSIAYEYPVEVSFISTYNIVGVALNEYCCWLACGLYGRMILLSFDMSEEVFRNTSLPLLDGEFYVTLGILVFRDALAFVSKQQNTLTGSSFVIWTRKDLTEHGSWTKIVKIGPISGNYRTLAFWRNYDYLILEDLENHELVSYSIHLHETKKIEIDKIRDGGAFVYTETLVPVTKSAIRKKKKSNSVDIL